MKIKINYMSIPVITLFILSACYDLLVMLGVPLYVTVGLEIVSILSMVIRKPKFYNYDVLLIVMFIFIATRNSNYGSFYFVYQSFTYLLVFILCFYIKEYTDWMSKYINMMLIIYLFYAVTTIWFSLDSSFYLNRIVPLFPDNESRLKMWYSNGWNAGFTNHYSKNGIFLALAGMLMFNMILTGSSVVKGKIKTYILFFVYLISLLLTGKRGPLLFAIAACYFTVFLYMSDRPRGRIMKILGVTIILLVIGGIVLTIVPDLGATFSRLQEALGQDDVTSGRINFWAYALVLFSTSPLLGIGWQQYKTGMSIFLNYDKRVDAHNVYAQLLCETGIIGFLVFMIWFVSIFVITIRQFIWMSRNKSMYSQREMLYMSISITIQTYFLLYSITGNPLYDAIVFVPYFIVCAIALSFRSQKKGFDYKGDLVI